MASKPSGTPRGTTADADSALRPDRTFASAWRRQRLTVDERQARGSEARGRHPRSTHGVFSAPTDRFDPIELLEQQSADRVPELVPIRYGRMLASPFTFYRGAAAIMAADLSGTPRTDITVQLCGDAHLSNFGLFGTPERRLIFDLNDFDETLPGPWEWDVKRLAASFEILGRHRGFNRGDRRAVVMACARAYRERMRQVAELGTLEAWYDHLEVGRLLGEVRAEVRRGRLSRGEARDTHQDVLKARTRDSLRVMARRADTVDGELRIVADPPLIVPLEDLVRPGTPWAQNADAMIKKLLASYRRTLGHDHHPIEEFRYVHTARKVVGVGSVGTRCYIMLLVGRDDDDPLFLQVKEATASVLERHVGASEFGHHGQRVVTGQRLMQGASDMFLGWQTVKGFDAESRDYYVRQFHDWKGSADVDTLLVRGATLYARICGGTLARAHARWGDRIAIAAYLGKGDVFDRAIAAFSSAYGDQNERDYEAFTAAVDRGRLPVETGV